MNMNQESRIRNHGKLKTIIHNSLFTIHLRKGFTLIELLVAVAILGVLATATVAIISPPEQLKKTRDAQRKLDLDQTKKALEIYYSDKDKYPNAVSGKIDGISWGDPWQPYMAKLPKDPLSTKSYLYQVAGDLSWYRLYAKLENCLDAQIIKGIDCAREDYNYVVVSSNQSQIAYSISIITPTATPPPPTNTPVPATPTPGAPTNTPVPATPTPTLLPSPKRVFATGWFSGGILYNGNLGGLAGADAKCQARADAVSLGGTWVAWLSTSSKDAKDRVPNAQYIRLDNVVVANNKADLIDGTINAKINVNEKKDPIDSNTQVWTGTNNDGIAATATCVNWASASNSDTGQVGDSLSIDIKWSQSSNVTCDSLRRLYCFEQ